MIITNKIQCTKCGDVIQSYNRHDFKWCSCKSCAVDGGHEYLKRCGESWKELSEVTDYKWEHDMEKILCASSFDELKEEDVDIRKVRQVIYELQKYAYSYLMLKEKYAYGSLVLKERS